MRFWKPCAWGFFGPGKPNFPVEVGPASRHRAPLPSLVSLGATPRGREVERRTPPPPGFPPGVPAAISSFASGDSPLPVPLHLLAPMLGFLLSSPHTFSCRSCKKSRSGEPYGGCEGPDVELRGYFVGMLLRIAPRTHTHLGTRTSAILLCRLSGLY